MSSTSRYLEDLSRRRFIAATITAAGTALSLPIAASSQREEDWIVWRKLADTILATNQQPLTYNSAFRQRIYQILDHLPKDSLKTLQSLLVLFEKGSYLIDFNFAPFTQLPRPTALRYCQIWENGFHWQLLAFKAIKSVVYTAYWSQSETWGTIEYPGPVTEKQNIPSLGNHPLPAAQMRM